VPQRTTASQIRRPGLRSVWWTLLTVTVGLVVAVIAAAGGPGLAHRQIGPVSATDSTGPTASTGPPDHRAAVVDYAGGIPHLTGSPLSAAGCTASDRTPGSAPTGGTFGRAKLGNAQVQTAATIISVGKAMKIDQRGVRIALLVAMQESALDPFAQRDGFVGLFQQPEKGYLKYERTDAIGASRMFFSALLARAPKYAEDPRPDWALAELVQRKELSLRYNGWRTTADALVTRLYEQTAAYDFHPAADTCPQDNEAVSGVPDTFDPGYIISDEVFYNSTAMSLEQIRAFITAQGVACTGDRCVKNLRLQVPTVEANKYCLTIPGGTDDAAEVIWKVSLACHVNPQVMLVTLQKESGLLNADHVEEADYDAAWGWHCPDTGPGGTASCDPEHSGFFKQAAGMAKQWSRYVTDPGKYRFHAGDTTRIPYNVQESGCGGATVSIRNKATASLYNYTPYQPNAAALAAYPGVGDACSTYGNRNFYFLFSRYFPTLGVGAVSVRGTGVVIPDNSFVPDGLAGRTITAPTPGMAKGLAAGLAMLGTPYVWGGGTDDGPADEGCSRGGGAKNSCQGLVGLDCSGLTAYVLAQAGFRIGTSSADQRSAGLPVEWRDARPGDIVGYDGHVAVYLGIIDGVPYMLEAPNVGKHVHIRDVRSGSDSVVHRYWG